MSVRSAMIQLREELQMRQVDLASALGVSSITVIRWETEKNTPSRAMSLAIVAFAGNKGVSTACQEALELALLHPAEEPGVDDLRFAQLKQINKLVNDSSNGIIVSDAKTHEILYVNRKMSDITGKNLELASKMKCHEFLFNQRHTCKFCLICGFSNEEYTSGEYESPKTGRYYVSRGKLIRWNDRDAHIEYISDMTNFRITQKALDHHRELLSLACENAQMWVFILDVQTGDVHLDQVVQKALNLPAKVPDFIETMVRSDEVLSVYAPEFENAVMRLKNGEEIVELNVQTQIHSRKRHWVRFRAKLVEYDEDGTPKTAACSAQVIDEEVALRTRIQFEHEHIIDSRKDLVGYVISNLTQNSVVESRGQLVDSDFPKNDAEYDASVQFAATKIVPSEDQIQFTAMHDRKTLLSQFSSGMLEQCSDYQTMQPDGKLIWIQNKMKLMMQPFSNDIWLYEYSFEKHANKIMEGLLSASLQSGYEALGAVSLLRNQVARLRFSDDGRIDEEALEFASYDEETADYCERCVVATHRQAFLQAVSIETLQRELENKKIYRVSYKELGSDGKAYWKVAQYTLYDKKRQFCLLSVLDLEKLSASIKNVDVIHTAEAMK